MNSIFFNNISNFLKKRVIELIGLALITFAILLAISFASYSPNDPSFVYSEDNINIKNYLGIYGSIISDFLLQSFGIMSFLFVATILSWGLSLLLKKKLSRLVFKVFFISLYLIIGCLFIYITFNNSFWLVDNGNAGFIGKLIYIFFEDYSSTFENLYFKIFLFLLTFIFFILSTEINIIKLFSLTGSMVAYLFKRNNNSPLDYQEKEVIKDDIDKFERKSQQTFSFEKKQSPSKENFNRSAFKLPSIELLEKNNSKIDISKTKEDRPDVEFMEKILLDFGINGKITKINNGPVVSLYEFEPAPGVKVSKIVNLSDDLARNTSSTSTRVSVIPGKNTVGIEIPNSYRG